MKLANSSFVLDDVANLLDISLPNLNSLSLSLLTLPEFLLGSSMAPQGRLSSFFFEGASANLLASCDTTCVCLFGCFSS